MIALVEWLEKDVIEGSASTVKKPATILNEDNGGPPREAGMESAARFIDEKIAALDDWRGAMLAQVRKLIHQADADVVEEVKWRGVPVWSHGGIICTGETYKAVVKLTFARGASLDDPSGLFNASLDGHARRAIDIRESDAIDATTFKALIRAAAALNLARTGKRSPKNRGEESDG
jgi:hypothetical protein